MFGRDNSDGSSDTTSLWAKALGLGPIMEAMRDPQLIQKAMTAVDVMAHSAMASLRVEAKLDILLRERGYDVDAINRDVHARHAGGRGNFNGHNAGGVDLNEHNTLVLAGDAAAGTGTRAITGGTVNDGSGAAAKHHRKSGGK